MTILSVSAARQNLYSLVNEISDGHKPIYIKGKKSNAVLVSEQEWNSVKETAHLMSSPYNALALIKSIKEIEKNTRKKKSKKCLA